MCVCAKIYCWHNFTDSEIREAMHGLDIVV